jgi:oxygen-independent coproporphyrinogen-3 oxidase
VESQEGGIAGLQEGSPAALGVYVHIPFCASICNYCNFNRGLFDEALKARYVEAVVGEIGRADRAAATADPSAGSGSATAKSRADTIYFGGGTPSLLEPGEIARIIAACADRFDLADDREVTLEANPESVTERRLAAFRAAGVNRISFGVQSFHEQELAGLSRRHTAGRARAAVAEARAAGFDNLSLDLMLWLPGQQVAAWLESVDEAIALSPDHLSLYMLEVYPNSPLRDEMARTGLAQAPDEVVETMYVAGMERLEAAGYRQYEISNVARPGRASRHNLKYWTDGEWLGMGCGAHSTQGGARWKNVAAIEGYISHIECHKSVTLDFRRLSVSERLGDALFTGLRLSEGVNLDAIGVKYGVDVWARYGKDLEPFLDARVLMKAGPRLWLTRQGMLLAHEVMTVFV